MASSFVVLPSSLLNNRGSVTTQTTSEPQSAAPPFPPGSQHCTQPSIPVDASRLSSHHSSPDGHGSAYDSLHTDTPPDSVSNLDAQYRPKDYSEVGGDPFLGIDFNAPEFNSPSFLELDHIARSGQDGHFADTLPCLKIHPVHSTSQTADCQLISPDYTPSLVSGSPHSELRAAPIAFSTQLPQRASPKDLAQKFQPAALSVDIGQFTYQLTPETSGSGRSSEDSLGATTPSMPYQSPRVTVSPWNSGDHEGELTVADMRDLAATDVPSNNRRGLDPNNRPSMELGASMNDLAAQREVEGKNQGVRDWLAGSADSSLPPELDPPHVRHDGEQDDNLPLGHETENKHVPGRTYFPESGVGEVTAEDIRIMRENQNWADGPVLHRIQGDGNKYQPETSQAAIDKFNRLCRDTDSVLSRVATWGTRRRSFPSVLDVEGVTSGSFLKKLSIANPRRSSILGGMKDLLKKPGGDSKRPRAPEEEPDVSSTDPWHGQDSLAPLPPRRTGGGLGKKHSVPSINTALVSMSHSAAAIAATHVRSGSISATPITSPRSPNALSLGVKAIMRRPRSTSGLADMWMKAGGPPVANLAKPVVSTANLDDDEDEDDDLHNDPDMARGINKMVDDIDPTIAGFRGHILKLNPQLVSVNSYLADRIAHQQVVRFKTLLSAKAKHLNLISSGNCANGSMCVAQGGSAIKLDSRGNPPLPDPLSAIHDSWDGNTSPGDARLCVESLPQDIPLPPTSSVPAKFECQLCFKVRAFQKPSDWTKHVYEDVQPYTCTWDHCKDPNMFKRKADWVRHENEGHRHLEWWTCNIDECNHVCYRRDNFLQHMVREHGFVEPKVKSKAAAKREGVVDPTWQAVEKCHEETQKRAEDEPCRFCGKTFAVWKKLLSHLAKHMEQMSLQVPHIVAKKHLDLDTTISPIQNPPPQSSQALPTEPRELAVFTGPSNNMGYAPTLSSPLDSMPYHNPQQHHQTHVYSTPMVPSSLPADQSGRPFYNHSQFEGLSQAHNSSTTPIGIQVNRGWNDPVADSGGYNRIPVTISEYMQHTVPYGSVPHVAEPFPALTMNTLNLQGLPNDDSGNQEPLRNLIDPTSIPNALNLQGLGNSNSYNFQGDQGLYDNNFVNPFGANGESRS